eukprot:TRINITY_DN9891_c0_g3_i1.p1 TRINITY_DN9891_c0_g3~~TRINITY_DN9891_c0_g3_i1.p1  ORF type:complete len:143 (+),score=24.97 TRINITY_DN9891_c0_g3_i1:30-458(+)
MVPSSIRPGLNSTVLFCVSKTAALFTSSVSGLEGGRECLRLSTKDVMDAAMDSSSSATSTDAALCLRAMSAATASPFSRDRQVASQQPGSTSPKLLSSQEIHFPFPPSPPLLHRSSSSKFQNKNHVHAPAGSHCLSYRPPKP